MTFYVLGFLFSGPRVLLIRKNRPAWQRGHLNGLGGKVEGVETLQQAISREVCEESGLATAAMGWEHVVTLRKPEWVTHVFAYFALPFELIEGREPRTVTDEEVGWVSVDHLPRDVVSNLNWLVPMCLDRQAITYEVTNARP